jgi:hypothetical protein
MAPSKTGMRTRPDLVSGLRQLAAEPPPTWAEVGLATRPSLHGLIRYPAMMIPKMQGDIIDVVLKTAGQSCRVIDPFVGSGTTMTEAVIRGLDFTGIDINPLAALVCEAKAAIDAGVDIDIATVTTISALRTDVCETIDVTFASREKWFSDESAQNLSRLRRAIQTVVDQKARKVLWTVFAETVRRCSNSRTSTYKLHIRRADDLVDGDQVIEVFQDVLRQTLRRIKEYRTEHLKLRKRVPKVQVICGDIREAKIPKSKAAHDILVTSPPYGDNQTTIPYGQFSFLTLQWIPPEDMPAGCTPELLANTHSLDSASLGGSSVDAEHKESAMRLVSPAFGAFMQAAYASRKTTAVRKVAAFMYDYLEALSQVRAQTGTSSAHWIVTTGNRTAAGMKVPFDGVCRDIVEFLGGKPIASLHRTLPTKRMPSKNSMGDMITAETTLVAEFAA